MTFDNFLTTASLISFVVCYIGYRHSFKHVYLKYKDQKVCGRTKGLKK